MSFLNTIKNISPRKHKQLRREKVGKFTSSLAVMPAIRNFINNQQRKVVKIAIKNYAGCVIDGRDIGSKVFKNAKIKLFIDANLEIRAKRRHKQLIEQGEKSIYTRTLKEIKLRDKTDKNRSDSPLVIPKGAVIINNSKSFKNTITQVNKALNKLSI